MKKQKTTMIAMLFMAGSAIFSSSAQIFFKYAADAMKNIQSLIFNYYIYAAIALLVIGLLFMIKAMRRGELSVVYPILATSFIWVSILSPIFFENDFMTLNKWIGVVIIILGVSLVGIGGQK